jgi:hypothetical protein
MTKHHVLRALVQQGFAHALTDWPYASLLLPYAVADLGNDRYILLNRNYKPLGIDTKQRVDYQAPEYEFARIVAKPKGEFTDVGGQRFMWFYNDSTVPCAPNLLAEYAYRFHEFLELTA